jgi:hypothetical protein
MMMCIGALTNAENFSWMLASLLVVSAIDGSGYGWSTRVACPDGVSVEGELLLLDAIVPT